MRELNHEWVEAGRQALRAMDHGQPTFTQEAEAVLAAVVPLIEAQWEQVGVANREERRFVPNDEIVNPAWERYPGSGWGRVFVKKEQP